MAIELGFFCIAEYTGAKFRTWTGKDKQQPGRQRTFKTITHRFSWPTDNGDEQMNVTEWLPDESPAMSLRDCENLGLIKYARGHIYRIEPQGVSEEGGIKQCQARSIVQISEGNNGEESVSTLLAGRAPVAEEPAAMRR